MRVKYTFPGESQRQKSDYLQCCYYYITGYQL